MPRAAKPSTVSGVFIVRNARGLHTRPSTEIVKCASRFKSDVTLTFHGVTIDAKSLMDILMLAAGKNTKITVEAKGKDAQEAVDALLQLADNNFNIDY